jgi:hypothetical protein
VLARGLGDRAPVGAVDVLTTQELGLHRSQVRLGVDAAVERATLTRAEAADAPPSRLAVPVCADLAAVAAGVPTVLDVSHQPAFPRRPGGMMPRFLAVKIHLRTAWTVAPDCSASRGAGARSPWATRAVYACATLCRNSYETTVSPAPRNLLAMATAKAGPAELGDVEQDRRELQELEAWAATATLGSLVGHPDALAHAAGVLVGAKAQADLAELTRWAATVPPVRHDPVREQVERARTRWQRNNAYSAGLAEAMARPHCGHRSCLGLGRCVYG